MLGNRDVLQAELPRGFRHLADAVVAVGCRGVHVQVAAQVVAGNQLRQTASPGRLDLAAILPQLRRNPGQADGGEYRFFRLAGDPLLVVKDSVLVDLRPCS
jgi:hypothetical protein